MSWLELVKYDLFKFALVVGIIILITVVGVLRFYYLEFKERWEAKKENKNDL